MLVKGKNIFLRTVEPDDAEFILQLRLDNQLNKHISKVDNCKESQVDWIFKYKERELQNKEYYYIICDSISMSPCGTVRLYDFINDSFCWGSWVLKKDSIASAAIESALITYELAFYHLKFAKSHFDVRKDNAKVVAFHQRFGANITSEDEINYYFNYDKFKYEIIRKKYIKYLPLGGVSVIY